jgi:hypothetical protein
MRPTTSEWVTQREAVRTLGHAGLAERHARRVLAAGLTGEALGTSAAKLYDAGRVLALRESEPLGDDELDAWCPHGLFVARREVGVALPWRDQAAAISGGWDFSALTAVWLYVRIERWGSVPLVATIGGYPTMCADIVGVDVDPGHVLRGSLVRQPRRLVLAEASAWCDAVRGRRVLSGPGREWWIRGLDRQRGRIPG